MTADDFNKWLTLMGWSGLEASRQLEMSKDTVAKYRKRGAPKHVALACSALYHRLKE